MPAPITKNGVPQVRSGMPLAGSECCDCPGNPFCCYCRERFLDLTGRYPTRFIHTDYEGPINYNGWLNFADDDSPYIIVNNALKMPTQIRLYADLPPIGMAPLDVILDGNVDEFMREEYTGEPPASCVKNYPLSAPVNEMYHGWRAHYRKDTWQQNNYVVDPPPGGETNQWFKELSYTRGDYWSDAVLDMNHCWNHYPWIDRGPSFFDYGCDVDASGNYLAPVSLMSDGWDGSTPQILIPKMRWLLSINYWVKRWIGNETYNNQSNYGDMVLARFLVLIGYQPPCQSDYGVNPFAPITVDSWNPLRMRCSGYVFPYGTIQGIPPTNTNRGELFFGNLNSVVSECYSGEPGRVSEPVMFHLDEV